MVASARVGATVVSLPPGPGSGMFWNGQSLIAASPQDCVDHDHAGGERGERSDDDESSAIPREMTERTALGFDLAGDGEADERDEDQRAGEDEASATHAGFLAPAELGFDARADGTHVGLARGLRSEEHTSELQSQSNLVCRLL